MIRVRCILQACHKLPEQPYAKEPVDLQQVSEMLKEHCDGLNKTRIVTIEISEEQARTIIERLWPGETLLNATGRREFHIESDAQTLIVNEVLARHVHIDFRLEKHKWWIATRGEASETEGPKALVKSMSPQDVSKIITDEIGDNWNHSNLHGCDLRSCLVTPQRRMFLDSWHENKLREMWLVLEEHPDTHEGYRIVFDESARQFGLAVEGKDNRNVCIGLYGTFIQAFDGM